MIITPYPNLPEVLVDAERWQGFFYPLCRVQNAPGLPAGQALPILSTNGLWYDETYATPAASAQVSTYELRGGQVAFAGERRLFRGHAAVAAAHAGLTADWQAQQATYLAARRPEQLLDPLPPDWPVETDLDADYYRSTFRGFHYVREQYRRTDRFRGLNAWLRNWREEPGSFFLPADHPDFGSAHAEMHTNQAYLLPGLDLAALLPVGLAPASPYFAEGNSVLVYYEAATARLVCVNYYG
jgi:hypothetical protein